MTKTMLMLLLGATLIGAQTPSSTKSSSKQSARRTSSSRKAAAPKTTKPAAPLKIPEGAVKTDDGYRYTDKDGKIWIYRETPFGVTKTPETPAAPAPPQAQAESNNADVKAVASGDQVVFEKPVPFGTKKWQKKTAELNAEEQAILEREQAKRSK